MDRGLYVTSSNNHVIIYADQPTVFLFSLIRARFRMSAELFLMSGIGGLPLRNWSRQICGSDFYPVFFFFGPRARTTHILYTLHNCYRDRNSDHVHLNLEWIPHVSLRFVVLPLTHRENYSRTSVTKAHRHVHRGIPTCIKEQVSRNVLARIPEEWTSRGREGNYASNLCRSDLIITKYECVQHRVIGCHFRCCCRCRCQQMLG